jgi:hypothetical protein
MLYNATRLFLRICIILISTNQICQAARIYVKNWGSSEISITNAIVQPSAGTAIDTALKNSTITIQPGHSQQVTIENQEVTYSNFDQFTITYKLQEHTESETIYFPASAEQETSLYFTDSSYDRFPYNIGNRLAHGA